MSYILSDVTHSIGPTNRLMLPLTVINFTMYSLHSLIYTTQNRILSEIITCFKSGLLNKCKMYHQPSVTVLRVVVR